ncbi:MAG TPA: hypothetical protein DCW31_11545 [Lactobacillus sp.]|nr:hypothetical protein [Lactobacillus sp.]
MAEKNIMQLKISLNNQPTTIWRKVLVPSTIRYDQLNIVIQILFEWQNSHLHAFRPDNQTSEIEYVNYVDPDSVIKQLPETEHFPLPDLEQGSITYTYDFGDNWQHTIELEKMLSLENLPVAQLPFCLNGRGAVPVEDGGTIDGETSTPFEKKYFNAVFKLLISDNWENNYITFLEQNGQV